MCFVGVGGVSYLSRQDRTEPGISKQASLSRWARDMGKLLLPSYPPSTVDVDRQQSDAHEVRRDGRAAWIKRRKASHKQSAFLGLAASGRREHTSCGRAGPEMKQPLCADCRLGTADLTRTKDPKPCPRDALSVSITLIADCAQTATVTGTGLDCQTYRHTDHLARQADEINEVRARVSRQPMQGCFGRRSSRPPLFRGCPAGRFL